MNLKLRFALIFSFVVFIVLLISLASVYFLYYGYRKESFIQQLKTNAVLTFYAEYNAGVMPANKDSALNALSQTNLYYNRVLVYNSNYDLVYGKPAIANAVKPEKIFEQLKKQNVVKFAEGEQEALAFTMQNAGTNYFIIASAIDMAGRKNTTKLQFILASTLLVTVILSGVLAYVIAKKILQPVVAFTHEIKKVSDNNLATRLDVTTDDTQLNLITKNFNEVLNRLQKSFETQRNFVQRASHESRTPLASMLSQTEVALKKDLTAEEYKDVLRFLRQCQVEMNELTNSLLLLSTSESPAYSAALVPVRVDEILFEAVDKFKEDYPNSNIAINFVSVPENEGWLTIRGSDDLLKAAIRNLIKNAYLYSIDSNVRITVNANEQGIEVSVENKGKQLTPAETRKLFNPFFRGENAVSVKGAGLGLAIVQRSMNIHKGTVKYEAVDADINRVTLKFKA